MECFNIIQPSDVLAPYVKHYWILGSGDTTHSQRVIPSGNIELVFHKGSLMKRNGVFIPRTSLSGQSLSFFDLIPTGEIKMIAVVFHPFGAKAFFQTSINELSNLVVSADDLNIESLKELESKITDTDNDTICIQLIEKFLISRLNPLKEYNQKRMMRAIALINSSQDAIYVSKLAEKVCLSNKQFQRIFSEHIGVTPKEFIRIVRFQKALHVLQNNHTMNFTALAYECGYYDQAHMTNEFKSFSGYTPSRYVSILTPYSDYFSV